MTKERMIFLKRPSVLFCFALGEGLFLRYGFLRFMGFRFGNFFCFGFFRFGFLCYGNFLRFGGFRFGYRLRFGGVEGPLAGEKQNDDAAEEDPKADPLRGGEDAVDAADIIASERFDEETPDGIEDKIPAGDRAAPYALSEQEQQTDTEQDEEDGLKQRNGQTAYAIGIAGRECALIRLGAEQKRFAHFDAGTAADEKTADPACGVCEAEAGGHQVGKGEEVALLAPADEQNAEQSSDEAAVEHHTAGDEREDGFERADLKRLLQDARRDDPKQHLHADKAKDDRPNDGVEHFIVKVEGGPFPHQITDGNGDDRTDQNAKAHGRNVEVPNRKQNLTDHTQSPFGGNSLP